MNYIHIEQDTIKKLLKNKGKVKNIILKTQYDGTDFCGWQCQANDRTVQQTLQDAIFEVTGERVTLYGCSRTDGGVHAACHVSNFRTESNIPPERFSYALNVLLPRDVKVLSSGPAPDRFNSRFDAVAKSYRYYIQYGPAPQALWNRYAYYSPKVPDIDAMNAAAASFVGEMDFRGFQASGGTAKSTVRKILYCHVSQAAPGVAAMDVSGTGFLYNMVRIMAGTLLYVGIGKIPADEISDIIASGDRKRAGKTLTPNGLFLMDVQY